MRNAFQRAWRELTRRKARSAWALSGYFVSVCFLTVTVSLLTASRERVRETLQTTGTQFAALIVDRAASTSGWAAPEEEGFYVHNTPTRTFPLSVITDWRGSPHVRHVAPVLVFRIRTETGRTLSVAGFEPEDMEAVRCFSCSASDIVEGQPLSAHTAGTALLEQTFAAAGNLRAGDTLTLGGKPFRVAGVISPGSRPVKADIYLALPDAAAVADTRLSRPLAGEVNVALVDGADAVTHAQAIAETSQRLGPDSACVGYGCWQPAGQALGTGLKGLGGLALLAAAFFVLWTAHTQQLAIRERRRDIGILKAIGWTDGDVTAQILAECTLQALIGGMAGSLLAVFLLACPPALRWALPAEDLPSLLQPRTFLSAPLIALGVGILSGLAPAWAATRIRPADTLRHL